MTKTFMLEYWTDDDWCVESLKEIPGVFSQGETLAELEDNIREAYALMTVTRNPLPAPLQPATCNIPASVPLPATPFPTCNLQPVVANQRVGRTYWVSRFLEAQFVLLQ